MVDFAGARRLIRRHGVDPVDGLLTCRWDVPNGLGRKARSAQHNYCQRRISHSRSEIGIWQIASECSVTSQSRRGSEPKQQTAHVTPPSLAATIRPSVLLSPFATPLVTRPLPFPSHLSHSSCRDVSNDPPNRRTSARPGSR